MNGTPGFDGEVAIVTGGANGIGRAVAAELVDHGARVAIVDVDETAAAQTCAALSPHGAVQTVSCDGSGREPVQAALDEVTSALGPPSVLVNSAGSIAQGRLEDLPVEDWDRVLAVNLRATFLWMQAFARSVFARQTTGSVVNIASVSATTPQLFLGSYSAAKAGVVLLTRQAAVEWGGRGIRSNTVSPGMTRTRVTEAAYANPEVAAARAGMVPLGSIAQPVDIARVVRFLVSSDAAYINGADLTVDGGFINVLTGLMPGVNPDGSTSTPMEVLRGHQAPS